MSFFLGKNRENKPQLHVTSGVRGVTELMGGELPDTLFHSNQRQVLFTRYRNVPVEDLSSTLNSWFYSSAEYPNHKYVMLTPPTKCREELLSNKGYFFICRVGSVEYIISLGIQYIPREYDGGIMRRAYNSIKSSLWGSADSNTSIRVQSKMTAYYDRPLIRIPIGSNVSVDIVTLQWGSGYSFVPTPVSEIKVEKGDILLDNKALSKFTFLRLGPARMDANNVFIPLRKTPENSEVLGSFELINDPTPTGTQLEITPTKVVVKGRAICDSTKVTKSTNFQAAGQVRVVPSLTGGGTGVTDTVKILERNRFKSSDMILLYLEQDGVESPYEVVSGTFGPIPLSEEVTFLTNLMFFFNDVQRQSTVKLRVTDSGLYIEVFTITAHSSSKMQVKPFRVNYLLLPES